MAFTARRTVVEMVRAVIYLTSPTGREVVAADCFAGSTFVPILDTDYVVAVRAPDRILWTVWVPAGGTVFDEFRGEGVITDRALHGIVDTE